MVEKAEEVIRELTESSKHRRAASYPIAEIYAALDRRDEVFAWLEKAYGEHDVHFVDIKVAPTFDSLRYDPRYNALLHRLGL